MLLDYSKEYREKLRTPEEAVKVIKSGDWVDYTSSLGMPVLLDKALSERRDELFDVKIRGNLIPGPIEVAECDESQEHFVGYRPRYTSRRVRLRDRSLGLGQEHLRERDPIQGSFRNALPQQGKTRKAQGDRRA